ncbi:MAG TPA: SDR family oxidoreductase [Ktedonobacterales bacterium]|jgi:UDP-glucose 4-epimerase
MTARYLITGGAGFIGSHIAQTLLEQGQSVRVFDNLSSGREGNLAAFGGRAEVIRADLRDLAAVRAAAAGVEVVFHEAALASPPESIADPLRALEVNVTGTQHVLLAARDAGVRRVVFASSCALYGNEPTLPKEESMTPCPLSPYALHKLTGEHLCRLFTQLYGLETVALRYFNVFGPGQNPNSEYAAVIPRFLTALLEGRRPVVFGDGEQTRDFIYIENVVRANLLAAEASRAVGQVINIGSGEQRSLNALLGVAGDLLGARVQAEYREARVGDVRDSLAAIQRARSLLGYELIIGFQEGLERTLAALRQEKREHQQ